MSERTQSSSRDVMPSMKDIINIQRMDAILSEVAGERGRQDRLWGEQNHDIVTWMTILGEEFGEACKAAMEYHYGVTDGRSKEYRKELLEVAAVAIAAVESFDRNEDKDG